MSKVSLLNQQLITVVITFKPIIVIFWVIPGQPLKESRYSPEEWMKESKEQDANYKEKFPVHFTLTATSPT